MRRTTRSMTLWQTTELRFRGSSAAGSLLALCATASLALAAPPSSPTPASDPNKPISQPSGKPAAPVNAVSAPTATPREERGDPRTRTLSKMQKPMTVEFKDQRLEDIIRFFQEFTQAELEPEWLSETSSAGLDKDKLITMKAKDMAALDVLERVLVKAQDDPTNENGWQMTEYGALQIGPKSVLNREKRVVIYDINDLLMVIPRYTEVPQIDLQAVLGQGQGGSGTSPFTGTGGTGTGADPVKSRPERIQEIKDLITGIVEPSQWVDAGGEGATIREWNSTLIINAPDYIHRGINGYDYWPTARPKLVNGRRWVSLTADTGISDVDGFARQPVSGVVGGSGGGGGGTAPPPPGP